MPRHRRIVHRIEPSRSFPFDEQVWPVHFALLVLALLTAGLVILAGGWNDPRFLHNGWIRLLTLAATMGGLAWAANTYSPRRARRLHFAVLVSLITHLLLAVILHEKYLQPFVDAPEDTEPPVVETPIPAPIPAPPEMVPAEFERPLQTEPIRVVTHAPPEPRTQTEPDEAPWHAFQRLEVQKELPPAEVAERKPEQTRPRRAEDLALFNRRPSAMAHPAGGTVPEEILRRFTAPLASKQAATPIQLARRAFQQPIVPTGNITEPTASPGQANEPTRHPEPEPLQVTDAQQAIARQATNRQHGGAVNRGVISARTQLAQPQPMPLLESTNQAIRRSDAASPLVEAVPILSESPTIADAADQAESRQDQKPPRPMIARSDPSSRARRPTEIAPSPDVLAVAEEPSWQSTDHSNALLAAQSTGTQRASSQSPPLSDGDSDVAFVSEPSQVMPGKTTLQRAQPATEPSIAPRSRTDFTPRRSLEWANAPASPATAESFTAAQNSSFHRAGPAPNTLALTRANAGYLLGGSQDNNAGRDLPVDAEHLAPYPSTAARRDAAIQQQSGPALAPAMDAQLAKATAGADAPMAPAMAKPLETAELAGSRRPGQLAASASAAIERQFAAAAPGEITASVGSGELDTGSEQIVPSSGTGRSAGGGQPEIQIAAATPSRSSATGGGAPAAALAAKVPALAPAAPQAKGGGAPLPATQSMASDTSGANHVATAAILDQPHEGGTTLSGTLGAQAPTTVRQAERGDAEPGLASGGGTAAIRSRRGPATPALVRADIPAIAAIPQAGNTTASNSSSSQHQGPTDPADSPTQTVRPAEPSVLVMGRQGTEMSVDRATAGIDSGGFGPNFAITSGLPDRLAQFQSPIVQSTPTRFVRKRTTGLPTIRGMARKPAPAFAQRALRGEPSDAASPQQPPEKTEAAIELGLVYLARRQLADGRWSLSRNGVDLVRAPRERPQLVSDAAATGLALLAFLGAGYDHFDDQYQEVVKAGLNFLVKNQKPDGNLYIPGDIESSQYAQFYSHGIAAIALCEAYGMTGDPSLREPAQKAIQFIIDTQHPSYGGWRYLPGLDSDLSVTGWQVMALKSGELAGLNVPTDVYERIGEFLHRCQGSKDAFLFVYNPYADTEDARRRHGRDASTVMTSVGLLTSLYLGKNRDDLAIRQGAEHLLANLPMHGISSRPAVVGTTGNPLRDTYYWYYATQVMFHMKGKYWNQWNARLHPLLIESQTQAGPLAGSWNPFQPIPDQWVAHGGRLYVTTMNLLSLEVYYRHLPLYEATAR
ncbi:MAG: hypothetical protein JW829_19705 [Pirellulales bacterium]|nr:hypothetical protein [Pirellulales bacterium]